MLALDIGAGNTTFGKDLKRLNPQIKTVFCGDHIFQRQEYSEDKSVLENIGVFLSRFSKILTESEVQEIIEQSKTGVFKILAKYQDIPLEDESLDVLTLNSPHPWMYPGVNGYKEFLRVLKPGGVFYFGHSTDINVNFSQEEVKLLGAGKFGFWKESVCVLPDYDLKFPMSSYIKNNFLGNFLNQPNSAGCIYGKGPTKIKINANWKAWRKV